MIRRYDVIVLGAGAAGLFCAAEAGKRGRRVVVLERSERAGKKILISGGGRCNFTNIYCQPENFLSSNPHFAKSALARYTPADFIALVEKHGIPYHEKTLGQLFCDRSAEEILGLLQEECRAGGVQVFAEQKVIEVSRGAEFVVRTDDREAYHSNALVVATGGLSIPKMGATGLGYELARQFGLKIQPTRPALVPLVLERKDQKDYCDLAGVSAEVIASTGGATFREEMLITHRGLSGQAILQASSYWERGKPIVLDLAPEREITAAVRNAKFRNVPEVVAALQGNLPRRFAERWVELHEPESMSDASLKKFEELVHSWSLLPADTEGYEKAEVTVGGVDTDELSSKTMESRKVPGLFFIGEIVDVTGQLGGFNFQWAWASGAAAGRSM